jgi:uncharacterized protein (TIGR02391 family)
VTGLNIEWAIAQLNLFIEGSAAHDVPLREPMSGTHKVTAATEDELTEQAPIVEEILTRVLPAWRSIVQKKGPLPYLPWDGHRDACLQARAVLRRQAEIKENLGDDAPEISAADLHSWVWSGARSLWQSQHYRSAVEDAAKKVNAETQNKVGRRDLSETKLFQEVFSEKPAEPGKSRLRRMKPDGSDTYRSMQRGAMALAEGIYAGIRNPLNHESPEDLDEQIALEYLAALSVLARWVDESEVETVS